RGKAFNRKTFCLPVCRSKYSPEQRACRIRDMVRWVASRRKVVDLNITPLRSWDRVFAQRLTRRINVQYIAQNLLNLAICSELRIQSETDPGDSLRVVQSHMAKVRRNSGVLPLSISELRKKKIGFDPECAFLWRRFGCFI